MEEGKTECAIICAHIRWRSRCAKGIRSAYSERTQASFNSEASAYSDDQARQEIDG